MPLQNQGKKDSEPSQGPLSNAVGNSGNKANANVQKYNEEYNEYIKELYKVIEKCEQGEAVSSNLRKESSKKKLGSFEEDQMLMSDKA